MREIKFRAWSTSTKIMYFLPAEKGGGDLFDLKEHETWKVMQYTGLKDKNGTEIYEGDILETPYEYNGNEYTNQEDEAGLYRGKVHYRPSKGFIQTHVIMFDDYEEADIWSKRGDLEIRSSYTRVIGNIYENPELLGDENGS